ncbi:hypothetical protein GCM10025771_06420 [Niveibacterium umoris]|uniref:Putative lipoprotein YbaY/heat shock protein HslJ/putative lipoprotein NlpE involved in copper resistance n=1 Tax=Niveibacterium umoris TaxID=1193620 RepID=A0A840BJU3_9RHOO|nr:META domain-containing protein [Niveibacterium umoris]MBB4013811.1 putative lipoprotein YbaY/heat shock protein HslJ/putative lipoprotein NlpE involved in copper resistance [Niveibacterium umoris]
MIGAKICQAIVPLCIAAFASAAGAATLAGSAFYRERIALPPDAVFEATLEDVSRADAPAVLLGRARLVPAGQPPFHFTIEYDAAAVQPGHRYTVRATVHHEGRLMFTTDRSYPVLQGASDAPLQLMLRMAGGHAVPAPRASLGPLPASFEGVLPCADCSGTRWHLDLLGDHSYRLRIAYEGKPEDRHFDEIGTWSLAGKPAELRLSTGQGQPQRFALAAGGTLDKLDADGKPIPSTLNHSLTRLPAAALIEPVVNLTGFYRYMADAGTIEPCAIGKRLPVATEGDNAALERAYAGARKEAGALVFVSVEARIADRPPMEGKGLRPTVVVERFNTVMAGGTCARHEQPSPLAAATLQETYWRLTHLGTVPVEKPAQQPEPHFVLHTEGARVSGSAGCNRLTGGYTLKGDELSFGRVASTMMACVEGMEQEQRFLAALAEVRHWRIEGQRLVLRDAKGATLARFEAVALR